MNIDKLEAGPELDVLVAEKVMGWNRLSLRENKGFAIPKHQRQLWRIPVPGVVTFDVPRWSTDIVAAWEMETKIVDDTGAIMMLNDYGGPEGNFERYCCTIVKEHNPVEGGNDWGAEGWADTAPLAICRAALQITLGGSDG